MGNKYRKRSKMLQKIQRNGGFVCDKPRKFTGNTRRGFSIPKGFKKPTIDEMFRQSEQYRPPQPIFNKKEIAPIID